ncbi:hypothetical protein HDU96_010002 [Phlyctochytrium bullatum]|nr:hypothetical protein HDU96_010002 [Phlyctochytrium bullatum]
MPDRPAAGGLDRTTIASSPRSIATATFHPRQFIKAQAQLIGLATVFSLPTVALAWLIGKFIMALQALELRVDPALFFAIIGLVTLEVLMALHFSAAMIKEKGIAYQIPSSALTIGGSLVMAFIVYRFNPAQARWNFFLGHLAFQYGGRLSLDKADAAGVCTRTIGSLVIFFNALVVISACVQVARIYGHLPVVTTILFFIFSIIQYALVRTYAKVNPLKQGNADVDVKDLTDGLGSDTIMYTILSLPLKLYRLIQSIQLPASTFWPTFLITLMADKILPRILAYYFSKNPSSINTTPNESLEEVIVASGTARELENERDLKTVKEDENENQDDDTSLNTQGITTAKSALPTYKDLPATTDAPYSTTFNTGTLELQTTSGSRASARARATTLARKQTFLPRARTVARTLFPVASHTTTGRLRRQLVISDNMSLIISLGIVLAFPTDFLAHPDPRIREGTPGTRIFENLSAQAAARGAAGIRGGEGVASLAVNDITAAVGFYPYRVLLMVIAVAYAWSMVMEAGVTYVEARLGLPLYDVTDMRVQRRSLIIITLNLMTVLLYIMAGAKGMLAFGPLDVGYGD